MTCRAAQFRAFAWLLRPSVLALYAALVLVRAPHLILQPHFSAEEGAVYFQSALDNSALKALTTPQMDYYSLWNNAACVTASRCSTLEDAPLVTSLFALFVQLQAPAVILFGAAPVWRRWPSRIAALLLVLFVPPSGMLWLSTNTSQFHLSVVAALILLEPSAIVGCARRWAMRLLLLVAGLTGPLSCFLAPVFLARALVRRNREARIQAGLLTACAALQAMGLVLPLLDSTAALHRSLGLDAGSLGAAALTRTILHPLIGVAAASRVAVYISRAGPAGSAGLLAVGLSAGALVTLLIARLAGRNPDRRLFAAAYACLLLPTFFFAAGSTLSESKYDLIYPMVHERYFYGPACVLSLLVLLFLADHWRSGARLSAAAATGVLMLVLANGILEYGPAMDRLRPNLQPSWREEVARWREDPSYRPRVWPARMSVRIPLDRRDD